jgi:hypothetical protein
MVAGGGSAAPLDENTRARPRRHPDQVTPGVPGRRLASGPELEEDRPAPTNEEAVMHAVVVDVSINDMEQARQTLHEQVVPMVSKAPGFVSGYWLDSDGGRGHSVAVFDDEAAASAMADQVRGFAPGAVTIEHVSVREVVAHA